MMGLHQILSCEGELQARDRVPAKPKIRCFITRHILRAQNADVAEDLAEFQMSLQIQIRLKSELMTRAGVIFSRDRCYIEAAWYGLQTHVQIRPGSLHLPPRGRFPAGRNLETLGISPQPVVI